MRRWVEILLDIQKNVLPLSIQNSRDFGYVMPRCYNFNMAFMMFDIIRQVCLTIVNLDHWMDS